MGTLGQKTDERVEAVYFSRNSLIVDLVDGRTISVPLVWNNSIRYRQRSSSS